MSDAPISTPCQCCRSEVLFDTTSLDLLVRDPAWVLEHQDEFWGLRAQQLTIRWGQAVSRPIDRGPWREQVAALAALSRAERDNHFMARNFREIEARKAAFHAKAIPHLCSFLPPDVDLATQVDFTAFIPSRAFAIEDIVINVASPYWQQNADNIISCLIHEVGHVGHAQCRMRGGDDGLPEGDYGTLLYGLQGEGFCDYIAYRARAEFPAPGEVDFRLYEDKEEVRRQIDVYNEVLAVAGSMPSDELADLIWERCITGNRAFYVAGMHCCHTIVETAGTKALTQTLIDGPLSFVSLYNSLVSRDWAIRLPSAIAPSCS